MSDRKTVSRSKKKVKGLFKDDDSQTDGAKVHTNPVALASASAAVVKRTGYMETRIDKEGWKVVFCTLVEGSLFLYKSSTVCH